jgi:hyperosmotically inducible periplasmic protein
MIKRSLPMFLFAALLAPMVVACGGSAIRETIDDATTSTRVKTALLNAPNVSAPHIDVETTQGVVTLSGTVTSAEEEQQAIQTARKVEGVRDVRSKLHIVP